MRKMLILLIMVLLISPVIGDDNQSVNKSITYRVLVDQYHGFYRVYEVYNVTTAKAIPYENRTFNISRGDRIIWVNDAVPDVKLTIISKENLWDKYDGELKWNYKQFIHTFNKSGIYEIYIKEYPNLEQKMIVGPIILNSTNITNRNITNRSIVNRTVNNNITKATKNNKNNTISMSLEPIAVIEKKPGVEVITLISITLSLIYIFERKIK